MNEQQRFERPQTASEVAADFGIQLSDLNYICSHVFLASICLHNLNETRGGGETAPPDQHAGKKVGEFHPGPLTVEQGSVF